MKSLNKLILTCLLALASTSGKASFIEYESKISFTVVGTSEVYDNFDYSDFIGKSFDVTYRYSEIHGINHYYRDVDRTIVGGISYQAQPYPEDVFTGDAEYTTTGLDSLIFDSSSYPLEGSSYYYYDTFTILEDDRHWIFSGRDNLRWHFNLIDGNVASYYLWVQWFDPEDSFGEVYHNFDLTINKSSTIVLNYVPVSEPATLVMLILSSLALYFRRVYQRST